MTDQQIIENLKYAEDIWLYMTKKYIKVNYFTLTAAFVNYFKWEKNETQSVEKAAWDIEYLANQILQLNESSMNIQIIKFLFLRDLSEVYESVCQTLKSQNIIMKEMMLQLIKIKIRMRSIRSESESEHVNKIRAEWMKSVSCYKCNKKEHIKRFCRTLKKNWIKNDKNKVSDENEKSSRSDKKTKKENSHWQQQQVKTAQEKEIDLNSNDDSKFTAVAQEDEAAMLSKKREKSSSWLIDSEVTSHCTGNQLIFIFFISTNEDLNAMSETSK